MLYLAGLEGRVEGKGEREGGKGRGGREREGKGRHNIREYTRNVRKPHTAFIPLF